jgi:hypothetical protein
MVLTVVALSGGTVTAGRGFPGPGTLARGLPTRSGDTRNALTSDGGWQA